MAPKIEPLVDRLFNVSDNTYLIAGAGGGLGNVMAKALAERGARLALLTSMRPRFSVLASRFLMR